MERWGFELSARTLAGQQAGNLISTDSNSQLLNPANGVQYIGHTALGSRGGVTGGVDFDFQWQAPDVSLGPVVFHAAGNATNNDFSSSGDRVYTSSIEIQPQQLPGNEPAVNDGGVVSNASFAPAPSPVAPGSIAAIFGTNLNDGSIALTTSFGPDNKLITELAGTEVRFNGVLAPVFFSTPNQLGVQIPVELAGETSASVAVTVNGQASPPRTVQLDSAAPGVFTLTQNGTGAGAILHQDGITPVTPQTPAIPGEIIIIFCTGLGAVTPPLETGLAANFHTVVDPVTVTIGGVDVTPEFAGAAPDFVGLNQVNVRIPPATLTSSSTAITLRVGNKESLQITVAILEEGVELPPDDEDY